MSNQRASSGIRVIAAVALVLVAAACGGCTATPATGNPAGAGTAASSAGPTLALEPLTQTVTAKAGGRSVKFPADWIGTDNLGILYVVTSQAANDRLIGLGRLDPGDVFIQFAENSILSGTTDDPLVHLPDNLKLLASGMGLTLPAPVAITSAGRTGARIDAKNSKLEMIAISLKIRPDLFADIVAYVPPGEKEAREPLILAIIESLEYPAS